MGWTPISGVKTITPLSTRPRSDGCNTQRIHGEMKWLWFLQTDPAPPPNKGIADTLDEAKAAFKKRYAEVKKAK
jgi:hypothetical protein